MKGLLQLAKKWESNWFNSDCIREIKTEMNLLSNSVPKGAYVNKETILFCTKFQI